MNPLLMIKVEKTKETERAQGVQGPECGLSRKHEECGLMKQKDGQEEEDEWGCG
jgi:hypothetical protein